MLDLNLLQPPPVNKQCVFIIPPLSESTEDSYSDFGGTELLHIDLLREVCAGLGCSMLTI